MTFSFLLLYTHMYVPRSLCISLHIYTYIYIYVSCFRLSRAPPPRLVWGQAESAASPAHPFEWYVLGFSRPDAHHGHNVSSITSDKTHCVNGLQWFARHADRACSLEQCSQPLTLSFANLQVSSGSENRQPFTVMSCKYRFGDEVCFIPQPQWGRGRPLR